MEDKYAQIQTFYHQTFRGGGGWLERENRRTRLPKSALLEILAEESIRTRRYPGIGFRGPEHARRAWVIGTGLDVWELVELYEGKGRERVLSEHNVSERGNKAQNATGFLYENHPEPCFLYTRIPALIAVFTGIDPVSNNTRR